MCIENKLSSQGIHYLRYLMSWVVTGGNFDLSPFWSVEKECKEKYKGQHGFIKWIESLDLPEEEKQDIISMSEMGKFELEENIRKWFKEEGWSK